MKIAAIIASLTIRFALQARKHGNDVPDPKKGRLDVVEKAVTSGNLH